MKFPRNAKIMRSHFDVAPFAAVLFVVIIFLMLASVLPVPGLQTSLQPPAAADLTGVDQPTVATAVDAQGRLYFENELVTERVLVNKLTVAAKSISTPLTLIIHADKAVNWDTLAHLSLLARDCGITNALLATLPRIETAPAQP